MKKTANFASYSTFKIQQVMNMFLMVQEHWDSQNRKITFKQLQKKLYVMYYVVSSPH